MDKAPDAFRTISEAADELDVPQHVLRFWESRFPQIKPMKRAGGRRYYRPDDVDLLRGIRHLLYGDGYTIRGVQRLLTSGTDATATETGSAVMPTLFPLDAAEPDPPVDKPARQPRRRPTKPNTVDPGKRAALEEIRRELLEARAALAELLGPKNR